MPPGWSAMRLGWVIARSRRANQPDLEPLSVFLGDGVVPRSSRLESNHNELGEDLSKYLVVRPDDLVFNKLRTWQGGFGRSRYEGIVSPAYFVCVPTSRIDARFVDYQLHSSPYLAELVRVSKWQPPSQFDTPWEQLRQLTMILPPIRGQQAIADFLDVECARIAVLEDRLVDYQRDLAAPALEAFRRLVEGMPRGRVGYLFEVQLGKMLDEKRVDREDTRPYLRNANVHWDRIVLDDVKQMTFGLGEKQRFGLLPGDLLVCEGGEPGRAALWTGEIEDCYYQKALHRIRPYGDASVRFLFWCLRDLSERAAFRGDGPGRYAHLTAEQLRAVRIPMPDSQVQAKVAAAVDAEAAATQALGREASILARLLAEYREALITEAVTGQLDMTRISEAQMEESLVPSQQGERPEVLTT
jgi:type I restriction enzyme S subunit